MLQKTAATPGGWGEGKDPPPKKRGCCGIHNQEQRCLFPKVLTYAAGTFTMCQARSGSGSGSRSGCDSGWLSHLLTHTHTYRHGHLAHPLARYPPPCGHPHLARALCPRPASSEPALPESGAAQSPELRSLRVRPSGSCGPPGLGGNLDGAAAPSRCRHRKGLASPAGVALAPSRPCWRYPPPPWALRGFLVWEGSARKSEAS